MNPIAHANFIERALRFFPSETARIVLRIRFQRFVLPRWVPSNTGGSQVDPCSRVTKYNMLTKVELRP